MARYGTYHLLTKYNNPTSRSPRILINTKSYYHPYEMINHKGLSYYILYNTTEIGDVMLELTRNPYCLTFEYMAKGFTIAFTYRIDTSICISILCRRARTWIEKDTTGGKFSVTGDPKFLRVAGAIVETTLSEIYRNHLPTILSLIEI